jgi:hypothetical protein
MKLCKDCKWGRVENPRNGVDYSKCIHPNLSVRGHISPVSGNTTPPLLPYAESVRSESGACGPEGKLFLSRAEFDAELKRDEEIEARQERKEYRNERFNPDYDDCGDRP